VNKTSIVDDNKKQNEIHRHADSNEGCVIGVAHSGDENHCQFEEENQLDLRLLGVPLAYRVPLRVSRKEDSNTAAGYDTD